MRDFRHLQRFGWLVLVASWPLAMVPGLVADDTERLPDSVREVMQSVRYQQSHWGLLVVDWKSGERRYGNHEDKLFAPASVTKCFSVAAALDAFGADHRFETPVVRRGDVDEQGVLKGDLILIAVGDLTLGGRTTDEGRIAFSDGDHTYANGSADSQLTQPNPLAGLNDLARQVAAAGIKRVRGDVFIDDRLFDKAETTGSGPSRVTPILVNDNLIDFRIEPMEPGQPATIEWRPQSAAIRVESHIETGAKNSPLQVTIRDDGAGRINISGTIPAEHKPVVRVLEVGDATSHARTLFIEALQRAGLVVDAPLMNEPSRNTLPSREETWKLPVVAKHTSPPFSENARLILKVSHNLHASTLPLLLAAKHGERTLAEGLRRQGTFLDSMGVDVATISFGGGAGGARADFVTPRATVQLLRHMALRPDFAAYRAALPRLGVDGTLARSVADDSHAKDKIQAKTGTLSWDNSLNGKSLLASKALAGYLDRPNGDTWAFALFVNNVPLRDGLSTTTVGKDLGRIAELLYLEP